MKLWHQNILAIFTGLISGFIFKTQAGDLKIFGDLFINITKMLAIPLIFFSIIKSITNLGNGSKTLLTRSFTLFIAAAVIAALIGIITSWVLLNKNLTSHVINGEFSISTMIMHIFPTNFIGAFLEEKVMQIVLLAVFIAYSLLNLQSKATATAIITLVDEITTLLLKMLSYILKATPLAIFAYSNWLTSSLDMDMLYRLSKLFQILLVAYLIQVIALGIYIKFKTNISPMEFFAKSFEYQLFAFSIGSSKASLPFTISQAIEKLNISSARANLLIPLGASINVAGLSIYLGVVAIFFANFYNIDLNISSYLLILTISVLAPIGSAGLMGGALLVIPMLISAIGLPAESLVLLAAIDPIVNGIRTAMNITIDVGITLIIDKTTKEEHIIA